MTVNCIVVDDEPLARKLMSEYVAKVPFLSLKVTCANAIEAMDALNQHAVDLMFLDVQMPDITGVSFLRSLKNKPMVILTTAYSEYALEGYELDVVDYLLKPVTLERFLKAVDKVVQLRQSRTPAPTESIVQEAGRSFMFVKDGTKLVKVELDKILFIEGLKDYVTIHTKDQKIVTLQRLKALESLLPQDKFIRIHNSYIVALQALDVVHTGEVQIGSHTLPISDTYKKSFREFIEKNQLG